MSAINEILAQLSMDQLAEQVGASKKDTKNASTQVITSLLGGMTANAQDPKGEENLAMALLKHRLTGESFAEEGVDLSGIDVKDGSKIVEHTLGASTAKSATALAAKTGGDKTLIQKLLPLLAPVVIAYIAKNAFAGQGAAASGGGDALGSLVGGLLGGGGNSNNMMGNVVGSMLGGGSANSNPTASLIGGLLGSGGGQSAGGGLGGMLGGMLGSALGDNQASKAKKSSGGGLGGLLDAIF
ncbi:MAG: DUF937 domain-containing protein [Propionibacteriaceae bacterium]|jgi:hypothetical protein|nr:DUF937 domain-containing protein [Propionibacteriaceae bacterium]